MKPTILLFITILFTLHSFAQQYVPMPTSDAAYQYRSWYGKQMPHVMDAMLMIDGSDTTVHGKVYHKIMTRIWDTATSLGAPDPPIMNRIANRADYLYGLVREDSQRVYFIVYQQQNWWGSGYDTNEVLYYDFNLAVGDTTPTYRLITGIDSVQINGSMRKRYAVKSLVNSDVLHHVEGMGTQETGLMECETGSLPYYLTNNFICFREAVGDYQFGTSACFYLWPHDHPVSVPQAEPEDEVRIYPNPFTNELHIKANAATAALLYNSMGQVVLQAASKDDKLHLNTSSLSTGIYFLRLLDNKRQVVKVERVMKY